MGPATSIAELQARFPRIQFSTPPGTESYFYPSASEFRFHQLVILNNVVVLIMEPVIGDERGTLADHSAQYGEWDEHFCGIHAVAAPAHFWGNLGLLVWANDVQGLVFEIWYFVPQTKAQLAALDPSVLLYGTGECEIRDRFP